MSRSRPLPRSLIPLPGESLPGFLLRLSFRLNQPPARIAELTGLSPREPGGMSLPAVFLAGIPETASRTFAFMSRLDAGQVARLGMSEWQDRYPPFVFTPEDTGAGRVNRQQGGAGHRFRQYLIFAPVTRYCPDCLAGDGSAVQQALGGPWLKTWHLPAVFACPVHRRLLEHLCPDCGRPVRENRHGAHFALLPAARVAGLHPAQCRTEVADGRGPRLPVCCGNRLDQPGSRRSASPELIAVQDKILAMLDPDGPAATLSAGQPAPPPAYFTDLRSAGMLICTTWPAARHLSPSETTASAIDRHVLSLRQQAADRQNPSPSPDARIRFGTPPRDAAASAGLACIADRVLAGTASEVREKLPQLVPAGTSRSVRGSWAWRIARSSPPCSSGLREAVGTLWESAATGLGQNVRNADFRPRHWGPEHIPAFLPEDWYARHFTPVNGVSSMSIRRTASLRLVQMAAGGSLSEAAEFLGIAAPHTRWKRCVYSEADHARPSRQPPGQHRFENALASLARELDDPAVTLVNYQHRRQALTAWCIDTGTWTALTARLTPVKGMKPGLGDRKRELASIHVWVQVTSGEYYFAPRVIEAAQTPETRGSWRQRLSTEWSIMHRRQPGPHYASLVSELNAIAKPLAQTIDEAGPGALRTTG